VLKFRSTSAAGPSWSTPRLQLQKPTCVRHAGCRSLAKTAASVQAADARPSLHEARERMAPASGQLTMCWLRSRGRTSDNGGDGRADDTEDRMPRRVNNNGAPAVLAEMSTDLPSSPSARRQCAWISPRRRAAVRNRCMWRAQSRGNVGPTASIAVDRPELNGRAKRLASHTRGGLALCARSSDPVSPQCFGGAQFRSVRAESGTEQTLGGSREENGYRRF